MLIIRREQMEAFRAAARRTFAHTMVTHLAERAPLLFAAAGEAAFQATVTQGMTQAAAYGFDQRGPVRLYLELMLLFGSRFDTDPQYPWAGQILRDRETGTQMQRAERLYAQAQACRLAVAGPDGAHERRALKALRAWAAHPPPLPADALVPALLAETALVYPEKADYIGPEALGALLQRAQAGARNQRFLAPRAIAVVSILMLALGHGCGADPLHPWIAETLRDPGLTDPVARAGALEARALAWLDQVLTAPAPEASS